MKNEDDGKIDCTKAKKPRIVQETSFIMLNDKKSEKSVEGGKTKENNLVKSTNVVFQKTGISRNQRGRSFGSKFRGCTIWLTGLSSSGKTTVSFNIEKILIQHGIPSYSLDGDNLRFGLCKDLGFTSDDRAENIRRVGEVSKLFADSGVICLVSLISPYRHDRDAARKIHKASNLPFFEIYVNAPLAVCENRDVKGLYQRARSGIIKNFTGIDSAYEPSLDPEIELKTDQLSINECVERVLMELNINGIVPNQVVNRNIELIANVDVQNSLKIESGKLNKIDLNEIDLQWVQVLSEGWATPLTGFMREAEYLQSLHFNCLCDGEMTNQSIPIVLSIDDEKKEELKGANSVSLYYENRLVAVLKTIEIYPHRRQERICRQFGMSSHNHPYVKHIVSSGGDWLIGGDLEVYERIKWNDGLDKYRLTPNELKEKFREMKADTVFAFQLRNPIHNGHALLMHETRQQLLGKGYKNPVLLLHPLGGKTKSDDVPLSVRMKQHAAILEEKVLNPEHTVLAIFPSPMMYAGPTEVQWHAKARLNAGAEYYIVGRDPAGLPHPETGEDAYEATHGGKVLTMAPGLCKLKILPFKVAAYDKIVKKMSFFDITRKSDFISISGTKMRAMARKGENPPPGFMAEKAWKVLCDYYGALPTPKG
ncbi:hypothetical protein SNEBB_002914 [Seison nebaliae]|nr:hypothetical protein SNEBB_002914 [Seison nebaliae]